MIITVAFEVKNYVEVMEGWPLRVENTTFFLERKKNVLKKVCLSFSGVGLEHAPSLTPASDSGEHAHLRISDSGYATLARNKIMNWQAVVSGLQIVDLDYDSFEMRFHAEGVEEESEINLMSFKSGYERKLNSNCDFEQIGRAFCADPISSEQIESTSHYREGRIAFEAGRYVDAYNNMFLFLETRYCDGKTKTVQQVGLLLKARDVCVGIKESEATLANFGEADKRENFDLFHAADSTEDKIKALVRLRGKLRHHSLKSPHRWDPNKQDEYKGAARFLSAVVQDIVIKESLEHIYAPAPLEKFRELSVSTGHETKITLTTRRLNKEPAIALDMSYPTTVVSSLLCANTVRHGIQACERAMQLADTVKFEAFHSKRDVELFSIDFDIWAFTASREIETEEPIGTIRCRFEYLRDQLITKGEFMIPYEGRTVSILDGWSLLRRSLDHIENKDPTARIMSLKLFLNKSTKVIITYRVGALVNN